MTKFYCPKKSSVYVTFTDKPIRVEVYNDKGKVYFFRELGGKFESIKFNVAHKGHYSISEDCKSIEVKDIVIDEIKQQLPTPDRKGFKPLKFVNNPDLITSPARAFRKTGIIEKGKLFYTLPFPIRVFILCHEIGHFFYKDEDNADLFAVKLYVKNGYNRSVAIYSLTKVLNPTPKNIIRVEKLFKTVTE